MQIKYSKKAAAILPEMDRMLKKEADTLQIQRMAASNLAKSELRKRCVLCGKSLKSAERFLHRDVYYRSCKKCSHIQTENLSSTNSTLRSKKGVQFSMIYPDLKKKEWTDRQKRIYDPKRDWIFDSLSREGIAESQYKNMRWVEIGAGAGYFVKSILDKGVKNIIGLEQEKSLVASNQSYILENRLRAWDGEFDNAITAFPADIYCAFFVLEHIENLLPTWTALAACPKETIFVFSVPVYGVSSLMESAHVEKSARNLDSFVHTQLFTDVSIREGMKLAGYEILSQWIFGQDAFDFLRMMKMPLEKNAMGTPPTKVLEEIESCVDELQSVFDRHHISDQRHILAKKIL